jgi:hypothetical protein
MGSDVSEKPGTPSPGQLAELLKHNLLQAHQLAPFLRQLLDRIEALEARNYQYSRELDTVLLRIRDDYHSADY